MDYYSIGFAVLSALVVLWYAADSLKHNKIKWLYPVVAAAAIGGIVALLLNEFVSETALFYIINFAVLFAILPHYYGIRTRKLLAFLLLAAAEFFYATYAYGSLLYPFIQMFAIGTAVGMFNRNGYSVLTPQKHTKESKQVEVKRDYVHMVLGAIILLIFVITPFYYAIYTTIVLIILGYIYNSAVASRLKGSRMYYLLVSFEKPGVLYGLGALYLGVGMALLLGFVHNLHFMIIAIAALFFADPMATIVGLSLDGPKLPYNKKKSVYGFMAFLLTVSLIGYPYIGGYAPLFGLGLAFVESITPIDDNVSISVVMILLYIVYLYALHMLPF